MPPIHDAAFTDDLVDMKRLVQSGEADINEKVFVVRQHCT